MNLWLGLNIKPIAPTTLKWTRFQFSVFHSTTLWYVVVVMVKKIEDTCVYVCTCITAGFLFVYMKVWIMTI